MRQVKNGPLYVRYRSSSTITTAEKCKTLTDKNLHCSIVKTIPQVWLMFLKVKSIYMYMCILKVSILFFLSIHLSFFLFRYASLEKYWVSRIYPNRGQVWIEARSLLEAGVCQVKYRKSGKFRCKNFLVAQVYEIKYHEIFTLRILRSSINTVQ